MRFFIDLAYIKDGKMFVTGWAAPGRADSVLSYRLFEKSGKERELELILSTRPDLGYTLFRDPDRKDLGYFMSFPYEKNEILSLKITEIADGKEIDSMTETLSGSYIAFRMRGKAAKRALKPAIDFGKKVVRKLTHEEEKAYREKFLRSRATEEELQNEEKTVFPISPKFSVVVPLYRTPLRFFREMAESVLNQSYRNLELVLVNGSPEDSGLSDAVRETAAKDARVRVVALSENKGISENTNAGMEASSGEFIALLDHDDVLERDALFQYVKALNSDRSIDVFYSDEDKITEKSDDFFYPNYKPDYSPEFLCSNNYICHFTAFRKSLLLKTGALDKAFDGAQDHDLLLRFSETTDRFCHVPKVLYHWRSANGSTSGGVGKKAFSVSAGVRAVKAHYERIGCTPVISESEVGGWLVQKLIPKRNPLVSILIPNKDHKSDLEACLRSLYEVNTYRNIETIVIENNSEEPETFAYYEEAKKRYPGLSVVTYRGAFNYSAINNLGAKNAKGEYLLLLNNDVTADSPDFLTDMVGFLELPGVGIVGAKLLYPDRTVQHAGVLVGFGGIAGHMFKGLKENEPGYMCRAIAVSDVSAVTAACLLVKRAVFDEVGGFDESFAVAFNDVDFCLKVREKSYRIVYDANAKLIHAESKSRGAENTPEKFLRFADESRRLSAKYRIRSNSEGRFNDPYYNPNLSYLEYFVPEI